MNTRKPIPSEAAFDPSSGDYISIYSPPVEFCSCVDCENQFRSTDSQGIDRLSYAEALSTAEASEISTSYAKDIRKDLQYLRDQVACHGNTIISRWKKRSREKRAAALLKAFPKIFPQQWSGPLINYDYANVTWRKAREFREALLLPYLNLEVLRDDALKFLGLLYNRTKFDPEDWVSFDVHQTRTSWATGGFRTDFAECCIVFYGLNYGEVVPWNSDQVHRWDIIGFPRGRLVLEAQHFIMQFLRKIVEDLLDGVDRVGLSDKWIELANAGFRRSFGAETWSAFSNQAYSAPVFDVDRLVSISQARLAESEDHLWLLQTDPAYFQMFIKNETQGRIFKENDPEIWNRNVALNAWVESVGKMQSWRWVVQEVERMRAQYLKFRDSIHVGERLPSKFEFAMASLELLLINLLLHRTKSLGMLLPHMIAFQDLYKHDYSQRDQVIITIDLKKTGSTREMFYKDPLHWCLTQMSTDPENPKMFDAAMLFGFLDDWLGKDTTSVKDKCRLDQRLLSDLSDLAANHELLAVVRQHRPVCKPTTVEEARAKGADRQAWRGMQTGDEKYEQSKQDWEALAAQLKAVLDLPFPKGKHDRAWLESADQVRQNLKNFWTKAREMHRKALEHAKLYTEEDRQQELATMSFDSTIEHLAVLKAERDAILAPKARTKPNELVSDDAGTGWNTGSAMKLSSTSLLSAPKSKTKTRPEVSTSNADVAEAPKTPVIEKTKIPPLAIIQVKPESMRVLTRMFPCAPEEYSGKPVDWRSFVGAMEDAGFPAAQSGGSAVTFTKEGEGRIVFHKPHPVAKIEQTVLQSWGKRMGKWFKWERETFASGSAGVS